MGGGRCGRRGGAGSGEGKARQRRARRGQRGRDGVGRAHAGLNASMWADAVEADATRHGCVRSRGATAPLPPGPLRWYRPCAVHAPPIPTSLIPYPVYTPSTVSQLSTPRIVHLQIQTVYPTNSTLWPFRVSFVAVFPLGTLELTTSLQDIN